MLPGLLAGFDHFVLLIAGHFLVMIEFLFMLSTVIRKNIANLACQIKLVLR